MSMRRRYYRRKKGIAKKEAPFFKETKPMVQSKEEKQPFFQTKGEEGLTIGQPGDKYEVEADAMADAVVNNSKAPTHIQAKEISSIQRVEEEEAVQARIQRQTREEEPALQTQSKEEEIQAKSQEEEVQLQAEEEELQAKSEEEEVQMQGEEELKAKSEEEEVQMQAEEEELQAKSEEEEVQMQSQEEIQSKEEEEPAVQTKTNGKPKANTKLSNQIKQSSGGGKALNPKTKRQMEGAFGVDFSKVSIHTNSKAVQMNKELHAHAFTHGNDIYFNNGKYQPETTAGQHLLAHELTHVVQQSKKQGSIQPAIQTLRVSTGGFGKTLEGYTNSESIPDSFVRRLRSSPEFRSVAQILDRHYVDRGDSYRFSPEYDSQERIISGGPGMPASYIGKKELFILTGSSGSSFADYHSPDNRLSGDVISLQNSSNTGFIQDIAHEACHAVNHVTGSGPSPTDLVSSVRAGIQEEISVRNREDQILNEINARGRNLSFNPVGSTVPAEVARDFAPGIGLTYLENFFFSYRLRETQLLDGFTDEQAREMRESVDVNQSLVFKPEVDPQLGIFVISEYGTTWRDRLRAKQSWSEFNRSGSSDAAAKESKLQEHARRFFGGLIRYTALP